MTVSIAVRIMLVLLISCVVSAEPFSKPTTGSELEYLANLILDDQPPVIYQRSQNLSGSSSFYFEGESYQGKPTRIFAIYNTPDQGPGPFPAIVLVHGGGGSAFEEWVKKWNEAGFAAIAIAVEGQTATRTQKEQPKWLSHAWGGPRRPGIYADDDKPIKDQWMYHASSATIRAHKLLRSFAEIDKNKIGLSGISWGGVITSTVLGFDQQFAFAIPIYGCGFLDSMDNKYGKQLKGNDVYRSQWEPALRIAKFTGPTFWMSGLKENNFSLDAQANTYRLLTGQHRVSIQKDLRHSHIHGWAPKEPYIFAQSVINGHSLPIFSETELLEGNKVGVVLEASDKPADAVLFYTADGGHTLNRNWKQLTAVVGENGDNHFLQADLPGDATAWFFNVELNGMTLSSDFTERKNVKF